MPTKSELIKAEIIEWTKNSTAHGITNLFKDEKPKLVRLMWLILFIGSSVYCCYSIVTSLITYLEFEVLINIVVEKDITAKFPTVSICNLNKYQTDQSIEFINRILDENNLTIIDDLKINETLVERIDLIDMLAKSKLVSDSSDSLKKNFSTSLDKMMISCLFGAQKCSVREFDWFYSNEYGNCYRFNNGKEQTRAGKYYGLRLELNLVEPLTINSLTTSYGLHVFINNNSREYLTNGLDISPGFSSDLSLTRKSVHKLEEPYSDCVKNDNNNLLSQYQSDYIKKTIDMFSLYQREACNHLCIQDFIEKNCQCSSVLFPQYNPDIKICSTISKINCINQYYSLFFDNKENTINCQTNCPAECDLETFDYLVSFSDYPSKVFADGLLKQNYVVNKQIFKNETSYQSLKNTLLSLNIFYSSFDKQVINEVRSIIFTDLLGSVGGTLGLFIGISLLSMVELIEIILIILFILFKKEKTDIKNKS